MKRSKERDRETEKSPQPDKLEVICPLIYKLTNLAVNYDLSWQPETKITVHDSEGNVVGETTGVWKSNPVVRNHADAFKNELERMRKDGEISWDESGYFFTHEEGIEARKKYEEAVLEGKLKAHITSWGPNPNKPKDRDKSRFHRFTGVTFQELEAKYPELYAKKPAYVPKSKEPATEESKPVVKEEIKTEAEEKAEPTESELEEIQTEEKVAAATSTEEILEELSVDTQDNDDDDHTKIVCYIPKDEVTERVDARYESICWKDGDGNEKQAYLVDLPEIDTEIWLQLGEYTINGQRYEVRMDD